MLYDLIVVGAGPTGSYVAYETAQLGYKVLVLEEHEKIGEPVRCTGIIGQECFEHFSFGRETVLLEVSSAKLFAPSGKFLRVHREDAQAYVVDRAAFDRALAEKAQQQGAHYVLGSKVSSIQVLDNDGVLIEVDLGHSRTVWEGKTIVIASGFGTKFASKLGLGTISDYVIGAQAEVSTEDSISEIEVYLGQTVAPGFFAWLVPLPQKRALVGLLSRHRPALHLRNLLNSLSAQGRIALPEQSITYGGVPLRPLTKTYHKRVLVVGDAAGHVKPTTGGGIYYGLLSAQIAADTLHEALSQNDFSEKRFAQYENTWKKKLNRELWIGYYARRFYERLSDQQINRLFHIVESNGIHESLLRTPGLSFDWHAQPVLRGLKHLKPWQYLLRI